MTRYERVQFTAWDSDRWPEYDNSRYLIYEDVDSGLSKEICKYGFQEKLIDGKRRWVPLAEIEEKEGLA